MKKVRFETPSKLVQMNESECQFPRPFLEKKSETRTPNICYESSKVLQFQSDPVEVYECSNSSPYPLVRKIALHQLNASQSCLPSKDLELSLFDSGCVPVQAKSVRTGVIGRIFEPSNCIKSSVLTSIENSNVPISTDTEDSFFISRENFNKFPLHDPMHNNMKRICVGKENGPLAKKAEILANFAANPTPRNKFTETTVNSNEVTDKMCHCHHCWRQPQSLEPHLSNGCQGVPCSKYTTMKFCSPTNCCSHHNSHQSNHHSSHQSNHHNSHQSNQYCNAKFHSDSENMTKANSHYAVEKKSWEIEKYDGCKNSHSTDIEMQTNVKQKKEPTVSDLFKIIKLQSEQLQLLQEKVDKFILSSKQSVPSVETLSVENSKTEKESIEHKVSIGVMTSFELVKTSTIINQEIVTQRLDNQVQCNRSEISIKEVVSKSQLGNENFLDGIRPATKVNQVNIHNNSNDSLTDELIAATDNVAHYPTENANEEKTLNEVSLYNVQVDNATTPYMSPEQSFYLDIRDYSDSESSSDGQSNVGWTYYNKVMNHVNGMLQDTDMPSSASALQRKTHQCVQMQIDKTNVSVTKRVKFGDDPLGILQPHINTTSDTSLKMNQLAAKYLKNGLRPAMLPSAPKPVMPPSDLSFATKNYMERHKLLQGVTPAAQPLDSMPRFLDITALKRQPKLL